MRNSLSTVKRRLLAFRRERDLEQFHTPKNLAGSICIEAAELLEHFQWKSGTEKLTAAEKAAVAHELADVFIYTVLMANDLKIDLLDAAMSKLSECSDHMNALRESGRVMRRTTWGCHTEIALAAIRIHVMVGIIKWCVVRGSRPLDERGCGA